MIKKLSITILLCLCLWGISGSMVSAQGLVTCGKDSSPAKTDPTTGKTLPLAENCQFSDAVNMVNTLINYLIVISMPLAAIMFAYAGWLYLSSGDNPGQVSKARAIFLDVGIGVVLILSGWLVFKTIQTTFLNTGVYKTYLN